MIPRTLARLSDLWTRACVAAEPWFGGFDNAWMDAFIYAASLVIAAIFGALAAMVWL